MLYADTGPFAAASAADMAPKSVAAFHCVKVSGEPLRYNQVMKPCEPGCACGRHKKCEPGCVCGRHRPPHNKGTKHPPGCDCFLHHRDLQPCGTYGAYQQHRHRGEPACDPCLQANRDYKIAHSREYQQRPEPRRRRLESYRKYHTGLTPEGYAALLESQNGCCAICGSPDPGGNGTWHVDHDHACCGGSHARSCGKCIRGALCGGCNMALGLFHDDVTRLKAAIGYLEFWSGASAASLIA